MTTLYFILALAFACFAVLMFICLIWASLVRCKKCGGWCGDDKDECEKKQGEDGL